MGPSFSLEDKTMRWAEITIKTTEEASEAICEMLAQAGADGIASQDPMEFRNTIDNDPLSYCDDGTIESYGQDVVIKAYFAETDDGVIRMGAKSEEFANPDGVGMIYGSITDKELPTADAMEFIKSRIAEIGEFLDGSKRAMPSSKRTRSRSSSIPAQHSAQALMRLQPCALRSLTA